MTHQLRTIEFWRHFHINYCRESFSLNMCVFFMLIWIKLAHEYFSSLFTGKTFEMNFWNTYRSRCDHLLAVVGHFLIKNYHRGFFVKDVIVESISASIYLGQFFSSEEFRKLKKLKMCIKVHMSEFMIRHSLVIFVILVILVIFILFVIKKILSSTNEALFQLAKEFPVKRPK